MHNEYSCRRSEYISLAVDAINEDYTIESLLKMVTAANDTTVTAMKISNNREDGKLKAMFDLVKNQQEDLNRLTD